MISFTKEELIIISQVFSARINDYEKEIIKTEKKDGRQDFARTLHAKMERLFIEKISPESKCGNVVLMTGEII